MTVVINEFSVALSFGEIRNSNIVITSQKLVFAVYHHEYAASDRDQNQSQKRAYDSQNDLFYKAFSVLFLFFNTFLLMIVIVVMMMMMVVVITLDLLFMLMI